MLWVNGDDEETPAANLVEFYNRRKRLAAIGFTSPASELSPQMETALVKIDIAWNHHEYMKMKAGGGGGS